MLPEKRIQVSEMTDPDPTALADRVAELVQEYWDDHRIPLFLSQLGSADGGEIGRSARRLAVNLADFVRGHLPDRVRVVSGSAYPLVMVAVPHDVAEGIDVDRLIGERHSASKGHVPRYSASFWAAFRVPLEEGNRRFLSTRAPFRFEDVPAAEDGRAGYVEVDRQFIAPAESEDGDVHRGIEEWLQSHGLSAETFLATNVPKSEMPANDLLGRLVSVLEPDDLKRMSIPLDVVSKLRRQPVR